MRIDLKGGEKMRNFVKLKATLHSEDQGKTWTISRVFYVSDADNPYADYQFIDSAELDTAVFKKIG
jgi:hypothetical protein